MRYTNGDTTQRIADVTVNGVTQKIAFVPSANGQTTGVASITVNLNSGTGNTLKIAGSNGGYGMCPPAGFLSRDSMLMNVNSSGCRPYLSSGFVDLECSLFFFGSFVCPVACMHL